MPVLRTLRAFVRKFLMAKITPRHSSVQHLRFPTESYKVWMRQPAEELLIRWFRAQLGLNEFTLHQLSLVSKLVFVCLLR